ncbi:MAG: glycosyltransferase [Chloroflexi bacterium]|nr:glycosyltransferase [Chloroflexota bacterium]
MKFKIRNGTADTLSFHQVLEAALPGDAIFHTAQIIRQWANERGYKSQIWANHIHPQVRREVRPLWHQINNGMGNIFMYHFGLSGEATQYVKKLQESGSRVILFYYDFTPAHFFKYEDPMLYNKLKLAEEELHELSLLTEKALAISEYSMKDLTALDFTEVGIVPPVVLNERWDAPPDSKILKRYADGKVNWLFVGRIAPNKRQEDIIKTFYYYKRLNPDSRLLLVGSLGTTQVYYRWLLDLVEYLGLSDVHFCGHVTQPELNAYYQVANAFVSMSEHEGFCVPLIESMYFDVPVIAYKAAAVPETLGEAGILIKQKDFPAVAELIHLLLEDETLRKQIIEGQRERLKAYSLERVQRAFWDQMAPLLDERE